MGHNAGTRRVGKVRIIAVDSFHINCYKCPGCKLLLSSEGKQASRPLLPMWVHLMGRLRCLAHPRPLSHQLVTLPTSTSWDLNSHSSLPWHLPLQFVTKCLLPSSWNNNLYSFFTSFFFFKLIHSLLKKTSNGWCPCSSRSQRMRIEDYAWEDSEIFIEAKVVKNGVTWGSGGRSKDKKSPTYVPCSRGHKDQVPKELPVLSVHPRIWDYWLFPWRVPWWGFEDQARAEAEVGGPAL